MTGRKIQVLGLATPPSVLILVVGENEKVEYRIDLRPENAVTLSDGIKKAAEMVERGTRVSN